MGNQETYYTKYNKIFKGLGIAEVVLGILCLTGGIATYLMAGSFRECAIYETYGSGIWGGCILIATGILGLRKRPYSPTSLIQANLAFSLISCLAMPAVSTLFLLPILINMCPFGVISYIHLIMCALSLLSLIVCIVHAAYCCAAYCCIKPSISVVHSDPYIKQQYAQNDNSRHLHGNYMMTSQSSFPINPNIGSMPQDDQYCYNPHLSQQSSNIPRGYNPPSTSLTGPRPDIEPAKPKNIQSGRPVYPDVQKLYTGVMKEIRNQGRRRERSRQDNDLPPPPSDLLFQGHVNQAYGQRQQYHHYAQPQPDDPDLVLDLKNNRNIAPSAPRYHGYY